MRVSLLVFSVVAVLGIYSVNSFITLPATYIFSICRSSIRRRHLVSSSRLAAEQEQEKKWTGEVVAGEQIGGCTLAQVEGSMTQWIITIDGIEADLGPFSDVIYKKIIQDAKQQRFQGFRPGTIPPHLQPTYRAFAMDECARETVLEAMQQNNIRPFENCRSEMKLENFCIPLLATRKKKRRKKRGKGTEPEQGVTPEEDAAPIWRTFGTMKEAIDAGWKPGTSFSFVANNVKGQKVKGESETAGAQPFGLNF